MAKATIFVLIKTSSEDEDERRLLDVFIKTNVFAGQFHSNATVNNMCFLN